MLSNWARMVDVDLFVDTMGNVPADLMNASYLMLKPFRLNLQKYVGLLDILDDKQALEDFLRMESGSSIRPTSPAKPSANSSRCSTSAMGWSPGRCASVGRQSICRRSTCRC